MSMKTYGIKTASDSDMVVIDEGNITEGCVSKVESTLGVKL